jgi:hypothetical protein
MVKPSAPDATNDSTAKSGYRVEYESLDTLLGKSHKGNPKDHDLGDIMQSILRFGFVAPVMIDEATQTLVAGHGRLQALYAMRADGYDVPQGIVTPKSLNGIPAINEHGDEVWLVPNFRGVSFRSEHDRDAYLIADNNLTIKGGWQMDALTDMLESLATADPKHGLVGTGYDMEDLDMLLADKNFEPPPPPPPEEIEQRFGIWMQVKDKIQENAVADLLEKHGWEKFRRMSDDG